MKHFFGSVAIFFFALSLSGCTSKPAAQEGIFAPSGSRWVRIEKLPPDPAHDQLLPTLRLSLGTSGSSDRLPLMEGVETLCGVDVVWQDEDHLLLRVSGAKASHLKAVSQAWKGIDVQVQLHQDQVKKDVTSADGQRRLVVIATCESGEWNLYLRKNGAATYNDAMETGWDDPEVFGGFGPNQEPLDLRWTGPRSAEITLPGLPLGVTLRRQIDDVSVRWKFLPNYEPPPPKTVPLRRVN